MHILTINTLYPPDVIGGAELTVQQIARGLAAAGHRVDVATLRGPNSPAADQPDSDVRVHRIPLANLYWPYSPETKTTHRLARAAWHLLDTGNPIMARRVVELVRDLRPDVVLTQNLQGFSTRVIPAIAEQGIPVIHVVHDCSLLCPRTAMYRAGRRCGISASRCGDCRALAAPRAAHLEALSGVIGVSDAVLTLHEAHGLFPGLPRFVVHNPLRGDLRPLSKPRSHSSDAVTFGFIGRLEPAKGIETLLRAADRLAEAGRDFRLLIAGRGDAAYVDSLERRWPLNEVRYLGFVDPAEFYAGIDALVFPSDAREALGNVVIEAYSQAVPVIATDSGGVRETVLPGATGFLTDQGDASQLARAMARFCDEPRLVAEQSARALAEAERYLLPSRVAGYLAAIRGATQAAA